MDNFTTAIVAILTAVIGLAIVSVLVKNGTQTSSVISASATGFSSILSAAEGNGNGLSTGSLTT